MNADWNVDNLDSPMNAEVRRIELDRLTEKIIGACFTVSNTLGCGFLEKVYHNALAHELHKQGLKVEPERPIVIKYDGVVVGDYVADILVEDVVLVEVKAIKAFDDVHSAQCMNYLRATGLTVCILANFGTPKVGIKRIVRNF
jgi:GxxExxY protein